MHTRRDVIKLGGACAAALLPQQALAQQWPDRQLRIVIGFPPGPLDIIGRPVAIKLQEVLGQSVIFENRPGANGSIATQQVAKSDPDGYTILLGTSGTHVTAVHLFKNLRYDPVKDFDPVIAAVEPATCLVAHPGVPAKNVAELIAYLKANPGKLSYASTGVGSVFHLAGELLKQTAGVDMVHVPYKGAEGAMTDLIAGHIPLAFSSVSIAGPHVRSGGARMIAILEPERFALMPDAPSITESLPAFRKPSTWFGFFVPRGTPPQIVARLNREIGNILKTPDILTRMQEAGYGVIGGPPEKLRDLMADGIERFGKIIEAAGIKPE